MQSSPVEQIRSSVDIVRLVSQHVPLKKAGRTFKGLCPFHSEKTPSFVVFPETGRWHCFGCGEGGDIFTFLMKIENLTFPESLRRLAEDAGIPLDSFQTAAKDKELYDRLYSANEAAALFYHGLLLNSPTVREYVRSRGITDDTARKFLLGLAPEADDALQHHLQRNGFTLDEMLTAGLLYQPDTGAPRDRFHGRLVFPIRDAKEHVVSFGARALAAGQQPKYLNGPQTDLFDKGSTLYGLSLAASAIKREKRAVVVEGYVDVVIAHQGGFDNVVATLGTSLTERHVQGLRRMAPEICLALDADPAGQHASQRGGEIGPQAVPGVQLPAGASGAEPRLTLGRVGSARPLLGFDRVSVTVALLPSGKDPDEVILESPEAWREAVANARPVMEQAIIWAGARYDIQTLQGKREAAEALTPLLAEVADPVSRAYYLELAARELKVDRGALAEQLATLRHAAGRRTRTAPSTGTSTNSRAPLGHPETYAVTLVVEAAQRGLMAPEFHSGQIAAPELRALLAQLQELLAESRAEWRPELLDQIDDPWLAPAVARVRTMLSFSSRLTEAEITSEAAALSIELQESQLAVELKELLALAEDSDPAEALSIRKRIAATVAARAALGGSSHKRNTTTHTPSIPWRYRSETAEEVRG